MRTHEIPSEISDIVDWASKDVYCEQESPSWSPYRFKEPLLTVWAVEQAQGVIDNGGFQYFFENDWPENPEYSLFVDAFRRIGATEAADCVEDGARKFPFPKPQLECDMRREYMDLLREQEGVEESVLDILGFRVMDLGGDTMIRLAGYIRAHIDFFPTVKRNAEPGAAPNAAPPHR